LCCYLPVNDTQPPLCLRCEDKTLQKYRRDPESTVGHLSHAGSIHAFVPKNRTHLIMTTPSDAASNKLDAIDLVSQDSANQVHVVDLSAARIDGLE
jgi:hypothetical protein